MSGEEGLGRWWALIMGKQGPSRGAENGKNKSRAFWPCSVGGMGGKEERFKEHLQMFFLDPKSHFHQSLNGSSGRLAGWHRTQHK